jgi:hypothetical protein
VITDLGRRHKVTSVDVLSTLGYAGVEPVRLPVNVVTLVPSGVVLDPEAAREPVS